MIGVRVSDTTALWDLPDGGYCVRVDERTKQRVAWVKTPNGIGPARLDGWELVEHDDGTITVSPSIDATDGESRWHGFLRAGVWTEC